MKIKEFNEGTGVWKVRYEDLPEWQFFIRADNKAYEVQPLLHVCEREILRTGAEPFYACITGQVFWSWFRGQYECNECRGEFNTNEELRLIWADGKGTGEEGHA